MHNPMLLIFPLIAIAAISLSPKDLHADDPHSFGHAVEEEYGTGYTGSDIILYDKEIENLDGMNS